MKILVTGATGLIGKEIVKQCLQNNIEVNYLTTSQKKIENTPNYRGFFWNPKLGEIDSSCINGVEAIIHLAGASISNRWTPSYKEEIIESRILSASLLFNTLHKNSHTIKQFISSSGVNIYPESLNKVYTEDSREVENSFLGDVVVNWEEVADKFTIENIKVAKIRTGMVLDAEEGALPKLMQPIKLGVGSPLGSGKQWQSWIHIKDIAAIYLFVLKNQLNGIFNAVAPNPVTNKEMTQAVAKKLDKPLWMPNVPAVALNTMLGEMATLVLHGQKISSKKLENAGFVFKYPTIEAALEELL